MVVSRSQTITCGHSKFPLDGTALEEVKSLRILGITLEFKGTVHPQNQPSIDFIFFCKK